MALKTHKATNINHQGFWGLPTQESAPQSSSLRNVSTYLDFLQLDGTRASYTEWGLGVGGVCPSSVDYFSQATADEGLNHKQEVDFVGLQDSGSEGQHQPPQAPIPGTLIPLRYIPGFVLLSEPLS